MNRYETEFHLAGWTDKDGKFECNMQELMCKQVVALLELFDTHGHSGSSAPYAINLFTNLAKHKPITPLTGGDTEWAEPFDGEGSVQNKRLSSVFKDADGRAYDIDGRVYWEWVKSEDGNVEKIHFSKGGDRYYIEFPYAHQEKPEYIFSPTDEYPNENLV